jgi:hypothetical protein
MSNQDNSSTNAAPLRLSQSKPFGLGGRRLCFVHPREPGKCVKVLRQDPGRTVRDYRSIIPNRWRRAYDNNAHELKELTAVFRRIGPEAAQCLPRCYGMTPTDLGPGLVLDLIRDVDGPISLSLRELISKGTSPAELRPAYDELGAFLLKHTVLTRALLDHNIVAQKCGGGQWRLYIIDGYGDPAWIPLRRMIRPIARAKIKQRLAELWPKLEQLAQNPVTQELLQRSNWGQGFLSHRG